MKKLLSQTDKQTNYCFNSPTLQCHIMMIFYEHNTCNVPCKMPVSSVSHHQLLQILMIMLIIHQYSLKCSYMFLRLYNHFYLKTKLL